MSELTYSVKGEFSEKETTQLHTRTKSNHTKTPLSKRQIIVHAEAFGQGPEQDLLQPAIEGTEENFCEIGSPEIWTDVRLT
ncbi:MAG: hypothetical protein KKA70_08510, partial [Proteobacteria bacterium]|nr:hypothetical protein [Pseudomonadota bacterium]